MPTRIQPLTDARCRNAKSSEGKALKLFDGGGLFLLVGHKGSKHWRLKYRFQGRERLLCIGPYPEVSLAEAREARDLARQQLRAGSDPAAHKKARAQAPETVHGDSLQQVATEWHQRQLPSWAASHADKVLLRLKSNVFPWIGSQPIRALSTKDLLDVLQRVEARQALDTARRLRQYLSQIYRFAIQTGRAERNPAADLVGATAIPVSNKLASIRDPKLLGRLLVDIEHYKGSTITRTALALLPMLFCRPGELRGMRWEEVNLESARWTIPPARQKLRKRTKLSNRVSDYIVPLPRQAVALLSEVRPLTAREGKGFVFPSERSDDRSISDGTLGAALKRLGYGTDLITPHGFRHTASTMLNETGKWRPDAIEAQLSHQDPNTVRAIYNGAQYLPERTEMMQAWADHLDSLKTGERGRSVASQATTRKRRASSTPA